MSPPLKIGTLTTSIAPLVVTVSFRRACGGPARSSASATDRYAEVGDARRPAREEDRGDLGEALPHRPGRDVPRRHAQAPACSRGRSRRRTSCGTRRSTRRRSRCRRRTRSGTTRRARVVSPSSRAQKRSAPLALSSASKVACRWTLDCVGARAGARDLGRDRGAPGRAGSVMCSPTSQVTSLTRGDASSVRRASGTTSRTRADEAARGARAARCRVRGRRRAGPRVAPAPAPPSAFAARGAPRRSPSRTRRSATGARAPRPTRSAAPSRRRARSPASWSRQSASYASRVRIAVREQRVVEIEEQAAEARAPRRAQAATAASRAGPLNAARRAR